MEVVVAQAAFREPVERRRGDRSAEAAGRTEAEVVEQDDHHVRRALGRGHGEARRRLHGAGVELVAERAGGLRHRQDRAVQGVRGGGCERQQGEDQMAWFHGGEMVSADGVGFMVSGRTARGNLVE